MVKFVPPAPAPTSMSKLQVSGLAQATPGPRSVSSGSPVGGGGGQKGLGEVVMAATTRQPPATGSKTFGNVVHVAQDGCGGHHPLSLRDARHYGIGLLSRGTHGAP